MSNLLALLLPSKIPNLIPRTHRASIATLFGLVECRVLQSRGCSRGSALFIAHSMLALVTFCSTPLILELELGSHESQTVQILQQFMLRQPGGE